MTARLRRLVRSGGFGSYRDYYRHILKDSTGEALAAMIDALATNHTSFLREPDHFDFLRQKVVPMLAERDLIEIWSAACSTGEEVWTLACLLNDAWPSKKIRICATDISRKALPFGLAGMLSRRTLPGSAGGLAVPLLHAGTRTPQGAPRGAAHSKPGVVPPAEPVGDVRLAAAIPGHLLPQRDDLLR